MLLVPNVPSVARFCIDIDTVVIVRGTIRSLLYVFVQFLVVGIVSAIFTRILAHSCLHAAAQPVLDWLTDVVEPHVASINVFLALIPHYINVMVDALIITPVEITLEFVFDG
jgi:hypothetical protein